VIPAKAGPRTQPQAHLFAQAPIPVFAFTPTISSGQSSLSVLDWVASLSLAMTSVDFTGRTDHSNLILYPGYRANARLARRALPQP